MGRACLLACLVILVAACATIAPAALPPKPLDIGVDLPLTGAEARAAAPALYGIRYFVQTHPTLDGFTVSLKVADDGAGGGPDPNRGVINVRGFLADKNLVGMLGPFDAAVARLEIPIANVAGLAMISPATSNPCLTRDVFTPPLLNPARTTVSCKDAGLLSASELRPTHTNNFFRLTTTDELQGAAAADYVFKKLKLLRVGVLSDHEAYGQGLAYAFSARLTNLGGTVLGHLDLDPKKPDVSGFLKRMKGAGAQAIYYGGGTGAGGCAIRAQMGTVFPPGDATPFLGGDGIADDPACVSAAGDNGAGIFATVPIVDGGSRPDATATIRNFKAVFGTTADYGPYTLVAYDATAVLYSSLDRAIRYGSGGLPERSAVTAEVGRTAGLTGVTGTLGFDPAGDTTNRIVSIFEAAASDPRTPWKLVDSVDYSAKLPY
ncbi:MAG TPA: branched-chain amino acid ABC transporter substrate-binding protein [Candidatus Dormibacteraeota bacterium]|nr:branched-chain amino acid ABC transporter substrate-binding protein [Candidatus Dormibacteraeota bacterium]